MFGIQLGTLVLNGEIVLYLITGLSGWGAVHLLFRKEERRGEAADTALNAVLIWMAVWKGSLLLFEPAAVLKHPVQLLYFSGGIAGQWLASVVAAGYAVHRMYRKSFGLRTATIAITGFVLGGWTAFHLLLAWFDAEHRQMQLLLAGAGAVLLVGFYDYVHRTRWRNKAIAIAGSALIVFAVMDAVSNPVPDVLDEGQRAPEFELLTLEGEAVKLSDFRGRAVLVNFWATWCPPCRAEMPHMQKFHDVHADQDAVVLAVNLAATERDEGEIIDFLEEYQVTLPVVLDKEGDVMRLYQVRAYPTSYLIDADGIIRETFTGAVDYQTMIRALRKLEKL